MSYIGAVAVILAFLLLWREYSRFVDKRLLWCRTFLSAISDLYDKMRCFLESPRAWAEGYSDANLSECGFLDKLSDGADILDAYLSCRDRICIPESCDKMLKECFSRLGEGYIETELSIMDSALNDIKEEEKRISKDLPSRRKAVGAVLGAVATGIVILVI